LTDFSEKLTEYIGNRGWSREYVIKNTGIPENTLYSWETGRRVPPGYVQDLLFFRLNTLGLPIKE